MNELIEIQMNERNEREVSARELHRQLGSKKKFSDWWKQQVSNYIENVDYNAGHSEVTTNQYGGTKLMNDYMLTVDTAKEIALMAGTEKGKQIRRYFIEAEKQLKAIAMQPAKPMSATEQLRLVSESTIELDDRVTELENNAALSPTDYTTIGTEVSRRVHAYAKLHHIADTGALFKDLNGQIKQVTGAGNRSRIKAKDYDMVIEFINNWEPTTATMTLVKQTALEV